MTTSVEPVGPGPIQPESLVGLVSSEEARELAAGWRRLTRAATIVALLTSPALIAFFIKQDGWPVWKALVVTAAIVMTFRGFVDLIFRRLIPWPSLFGVESEAHREDDVLGRRRPWVRLFRLRLRLIPLVFMWWFGLGRHG